jgi:hypothetical protein
MAVQLQQKNPLTTADFLCTIEGLRHYFSKFSGVVYNIERPPYSDGLTNVRRQAASGSINYEDITLETAFDPDEDQALIDWCEAAKCSLETFDVTVQPVQRCNGVERRGTKAWRMTGARLSNFTTFESMDTLEGNAVVMIKLTFTIEQSTYQ